MRTYGTLLKGAATTWVFFPLPGSAVMSLSFWHKTCQSCGYEVGYWEVFRAELCIEVYEADEFDDRTRCLYVEPRAMVVGQLAMIITRTCLAEDE